MKGKASLAREIGPTDLVLLNIVAIVGLRWLPTAARIGPASLSLWLLALLLFFIPQGLVVSRLARSYPEEGGIYVWARRAFGDLHGFICGWCYWVNNLLYYPSLLFAAAGFSTFIVGAEYRHLAENRYYVAGLAALLLWIAILANLFGLRFGKWVNNLGAVSTWLPASLLIVMGIVAWRRYGAANEFGLERLTPNLLELGTLSFWSTITFGFAGLELGPVMSGEIREPARTIPRAIVLSGTFIALIYLLGTAAILFALPVSEVNVMTGVVQAIDVIGQRLGWGSLAGPAALLLVLGSLGGTGAWLAGSARIPFVAGLDRFLPEAFGRVHQRWHTPYVAILFQGAAATFFLLASVAGATVREAYLIMVDVTIIVYFIPYLYLFASAAALERKQRIGASAANNRGRGLLLAAAAGFATTLLSIFLAFIPPEEVTDRALFQFKLFAGTAAFVGAGALVYLAALRRR